MNYSVFCVCHSKQTRKTIPPFLRLKFNPKREEQTSGYQWGAREGERSGRYKLLDVRQTQGCIEQNSEYSQYFVITANRNKSLKLCKNLETFISKVKVKLLSHV